MRKQILIFLASIFILISCQRNHVKKEYYKNGILHIVYEIGKDGKADGYYKEYYPTGALELLTYCTNNKRNGRYVDYYPTGKIENSGYEIDGNLYGDDTVFYENGKVKGIAYYINGKQNGPQIFYSPNGMLEEYDVARNDSAMYIKKYDSLYDGYTDWWRIWINPMPDSIKLGKSFTATINQYDADRYPKTQIHVRLSTLKDYKSGLALTGKDNIITDNFHPDYKIEVTPKKPGEYVIWGDITVVDSNKTLANPFLYGLVVYNK